MTRKTILIFVGLWLATTIYIVLLPTRHYTPDAVNNLQFIEDQNEFELWHSQHLLAQWPAYWTYQLAGGTLRAWQAMSIAHALMAGAAVGVVYLTALRLTLSQRISIGTALVLWFSYGFWHYQSDPDIYSAGYLAVALLLLAFTYYLQGPNLRRALWLGLAGSLALLMHQLSIELGGLMGLALIWFAWQRSVSGYAWRHVTIYAVLCALPTLVLYVIGWQGANRYLVGIGGEPLTFLGFALRYFGAASSGAATWGVSLGLNTLPTAAYTFLLSWTLPPLREELSLWSMLPPVMLLAGLALFAVHALFVLR
ncbi:MAG: hypothetical protein H7175_11705, partial [Burkholderiales bacterium]|nr:hypothetical protein [Anaerolineae bacterium]